MQKRKRSLMALTEDEHAVNKSTIPQARPVYEERCCLWMAFALNDIPFLCMIMKEVFKHV